MRLGKGAAAILAGLGLLASGCDLDSMRLNAGGSSAPTAVPPVPSAVSDLDCRAKDGKIGLSWDVADGAYAYRVSRSEAGAEPIVLGQATSPAFTDYTATSGVAYQYTVTPLGIEGDGPASAPCASSTASAEGPEAPSGLVCRAKDGKVDVTWDVVDDASIYRVFRTGGGEARKQLAETAGRVHADAALQNGFQYGYDVVAVDGRGHASEASAVCNATPGPRQTGSAPPVVTDLACRGKNDKVDLTFTPAPGAAFHRVYRADAGGAASAIGETVGGVFVQSGLQIGTRYEFSVESVGTSGATSARSVVCAVTASGRGNGVVNKPPVITSQPLTSALEDHLYYTVVVANDPEGAAVSYSLTAAPPGMAIDAASGLITWSPSSSQLGPQVVEVRASDPQAGYDAQAFAIAVADFDEPPQIVSLPGRYARALEPYTYDVEAFDPESKPLVFSFGAPAPPGMTIEAATGIVRWTPAVEDAGVPMVEVRAADPSGAFASQRFGLTVSADPLDLVAPVGDRVVRPGETLRLQLVANYAQVGFVVTPKPDNASLEGGEFEFTPTVDQEGIYDLGFEAVLGSQRDMNPVRITVERENAKPVLQAIEAQEVAEGAVLRVAVSAVDPDGDAVQISAPGLSLPNAIFNELTNTLEFSPTFDQAGSYVVPISASDARESVAGEIAITVSEAEPPVTALDLAVDPPPSPTFRDRLTLSGSIRGEAQTGPATPEPLVIGLSPVAVRQGRRVTVEVTGRDTQFVAGAVAADFGPGITVESVDVTSSTQASVTVLAATDATLGIRGVRMRQADSEARSVVAFNVEKGAAVLTGTLIDSFTGQPLVGARVSVKGGIATAVSGADGRFILEGVDPGEAHVIVTTPNYAVTELPVAISANQSVDLGSEVKLDALARPFSAGGTLPRAASLPSLLDRGFGSKDASDLTPDAAKAMVEDTLLAIGGTDAGLLDEAGNQLNPNLLGDGFVSLTPLGVGAFAELLLQGNTWTLEELYAMLEGSFAWAFDDALNLESVRESLQVAAIRAWADPSDPQSLLPILLFNESRTLDASPPVVTVETRFNHLQAFLLITSFIHANFAVLDNAVDARLEELGIDPDVALQRYGFPASSLAAREGAGGLLAGARETAQAGARLLLSRVAPGSAWAAPPEPTEPPNSVKTKPPKSRFDALFGALGPATRAALISGLVAILLVSIIGLLVALGTSLIGGAVSFAFVGTLGAVFAGAFLSQFCSKLLIAFLADPNAATNLTPTPAQVVDQRTFTAASGQNKVVIVFERSESDVKAEQKVLDGETYEGMLRDTQNFVSGSADPQFLDYRYHLWKFPNGKDPANYGPGSGAKLISTRTQPVPRDPKNPTKTLDPKFLQFVIDDNEDNVGPGKNYYRVITVQFYRRLYTNDPDVGPDGVGARDRREIDEAYKVAYADVLGPEALQEESSASIARGELYENGGDLFGKVTLAYGETRLRSTIEKRKEQIAEIARRIGLGKKEVAAAQQGFEQTGMAWGMQAKSVDDEIVRLNGEVKNLRQQLKALALETRPGGLEAHRTVSLKIAQYLDDPANVGKLTSEIMEDLNNPFREPGKSIVAELQLGGGEIQPKLQQVVDVAKNTRRAEEVLGRASRSQIGVQSAIDELEAALEKAVATGAPVELPRQSVEIWSPVGSSPVRLDGTPRTVTLPAVVNPGDAAQVGALRAQLEAEERVLAAATDELGRSVKAFDPLLDAAFDEMRLTYMGVDRESANVLRDEIYRKEGALKSATFEKQRTLDLETRPRVHADVVGPMEDLYPFRPAEVVIDAPAGTTAKAIDVQALTRRPFIQNVSTFGKFATELLGPALDIGTDAWQARDAITVLRSSPSGVIHVERRGDGTVVVGHLGEPAGDPRPLLIATQPRIQGGALPEGVLDGGLQLPVPALAFGGLPGGGPEVFFDSGEPVARSPLERLRNARRTSVLRRLGAAARVVQFQGSSGFPLPFESDPNPANHLGILRPSEPQGPQGKGGYLVRDYPFTDVYETLIDAGFPSDMIAVDSKGAVYLENANSNLQYGGRIFRYAGKPVAREHTGSVAYYSLDLQYARPTQPIAMEFADAFSTEYGMVEDLFLAELDPGYYFNSQIQATNRILRLYVHQTTRLPFYANGQNRNRLVAQPYAEHPDFQMTGPSDLERDTISRSPDPQVPRLLFFSDEGNVFAISDANKDGQGEVAKILSMPGRRFSGLAVDANGHLYVADYARGEVFLLPSNELDLVLLTGTPITQDDELDRRGFLLKVNLTGPGDVELDSWQQRYLVATRDGIAAFDLPTVGRLGSDVNEMHVDVIGREVAVNLRRDRGNIFIAGTNSEGPFGKTVRLRVKRVDPANQTSRWTTSTLVTVPFGTSIVPGVL